MCDKVHVRPQLCAVLARKLCWRKLFMYNVIIIAEKFLKFPREFATYSVAEWVWPPVQTFIPCGTWPQWRKWHRTTAEKEWGRWDLWPLRRVVTRALSWLVVLYLNLKPDFLSLQVITSFSVFLFPVLLLFTSFYSFFCSSIKDNDGIFWLDYVLYIT